MKKLILIALMLYPSKFTLWVPICEKPEYQGSMTMNGSSFFSKRFQTLDYSPNGNPYWGMPNPERIGCPTARDSD